MSKKIINLASVRIMYDNDDGTISIELDKSGDTSVEISQASEIAVYGEGEGRVRQWLLEVADNAKENSDD